MAQEPLVSVVMPCLDGGRMLRRALSSVIRQTYANLEIVFVDNGSTDGSDRLAQEIGSASGREFRFAVCPERGVNRARALGFSLARGDYIQWMDADDEMNPDKVALQVAALERHRAFDLAFCDWVTRRYDAGDPPIDVPHNLAPVHDQLLRMLSGVWYPPHVYLLRRAVAERLHEEKAWWPERRVATDVEYFAFAALLGYRFLHVPGAQVLYNVGAHAQQISAVTPYAVRVISLRDIYARLGEIAELPAFKPRITGRHRALLKQNWDLWRLPPDSVDITKLNGREFRLVQRGTGRTLKLRPREAATVEALRRIASPQALAHLAPHIIAAIGATPGERATIIETLERLRQAGILTRTTSLDRIALESDEIVPANDAASRGSAAGETRVLEGPLVSVVIPCLNAGRMLPRALNSVIGQTHRNLEIIVVDNGSTDGSDRLAQEIGGASGREFQFAVCPERGANRAHNLGYGLARGDYVQWLDADDEIDRDKIARQVDALERDRGYDIAYCDWTQRTIYGDSRPTVLVRKALEQVDDQILRILVGVWYPPHVHLLRRSAADQLDREQAWWPDRPNSTCREYFGFAALLGFRFLHVPQAHVYYNKWSRTQVSNSTPYSARVATLRAIFARFRELAERPTTKPRITAAHRLFLNQSWDLWSVPGGSVHVARIGNGAIRLRQIETGQELVLSTEEAAIVEVLQSIGEARAFSHLVLAIADNAPELGHDYVGIITALDRLREVGVLVRAASIDQTAPPNDEIARDDDGAPKGSAAGETRVLEGPLVSVVIPCLNAGRMLPRALNSAIGQTHRNLEIIVVDNGSTDGSDRLAQEIGGASGREFRFARCPERGANRARNRGYGLVRGDYVQWLDADDELDTEKIARQVDALERDRGYDIAYCDWTRRVTYGDSRPTVLVRKALEQVDDQIFRLLVGFFYPPHAYLLRRSAADQLDREQAWWPDRFYCDDREYFACAALLGFRFLHVPRAHVYYNKWSSTQISTATPYLDRVANLRAAFARLRELAERPTVKPRITAAHRLFLEQNWDLWSLPRSSVDVARIGNGSIRLRQIKTGRELVLSTKEAAIVGVLQSIGEARAFSHLVVAIAGNASELDNDCVGIMTALDRLREAGILVRAASIDQTAPPNDEIPRDDDGAPKGSAAGETRVLDGPRVSVVIPCLNAGRMLPRALNSVIGQTHRNLEIIVVDNGSTDGSDRLAQEIGGASGRDFRFARCPERGANRARNRGYGLVRGDYVQWLDADDELDREKIARQVDALERDRGYDIAYCDWTQRTIYGASGPTVIIPKPLEQVEDQMLRVLVGIWYPPHSYLFRRAAADQLDREQAWWPDRPNATDWEYVGFAALLGFRFLHVPGAHVFYNKWSGTQISNVTRHPERATASRAIFARFRELAERPTTKPLITAVHRLFLEQNWDLWRLPRGSVDVVAVGSQSIRLRHLGRGRQLTISANEAKIIEVLQTVDAPRPLSSLVRAIADTTPELENDYVAIMTALERLRAEDVLDHSTLPAVPASAPRLGYGSADKLGVAP